MSASPPVPPALPPLPAGPDKKSDPDPPWTQRQQQFVDRSRDHALRLEALTYAYRRNVAWIEFLQQLLDGASAMLAIWAMYAAWANSSLNPPGDEQKRMNDWISVVGAGLSLSVLCLQIWSWRGSWTPKAEKLRELADKASSFAARFRTIVEAEKFDETVFKKTETELRTFESEAAHPLGNLNRSYKRLGFQHVCQKYPVQNIECTTCRRKWEVLSKKRKSVWNLFRVWNCDNCGISQ